MINIGDDTGARFVKTCIVGNEKIPGASIQEAGRGINESIEAFRTIPI